jgi:hemerythrin-like metal-binding protein
MAPIEWKPEYSVGDPAVDHEHRELIELVNTTAGDILDRRPEADIARGFGDLFRAISAHFAHEERQMREAGYGGLATHKADHERLLDVLRDIMDGGTAEPTGSADRLVATLESWFADHFRVHDGPLHRVLGPHDHS